MKSNQGPLQMAPGVLFLVTGAFWAGVVALGGGAYLSWAAITALASGVLLLAYASMWVTKPLATASCLFGLVLTLYQLYLGLTDLGTVLQTTGIYDTAIFAVFTLVYLYLLFSLLRKEES